MDCSITLEYLERFQTLVVGVLGFLGVMATLWYNANLLRKQRTGEVAKERTLREENRKHERENLRVALLAELDINREYIEEQLEFEKDQIEEIEAPVLVPLNYLNGVYSAFLPKLGELSESEVKKIMQVYLLIQELNAYLIGLGSHHYKDSQHVMVETKYMELVTNREKKIIQSINDAIKALQVAESQADEAVRTPPS